MKTVMIIITAVALSVCAVGCSQPPVADNSPTTTPAVVPVVQVTSTTIQATTETTTTTVEPIATTTTLKTKTDVAVVEEPTYNVHTFDHWMVSTTYDYEVVEIVVDEPNKLYVNIYIDDIPATIRVNENTIDQVGAAVKSLPANKQFFAVEPEPGNQLWEARFAGNFDKARAFLLSINDPAQLVIEPVVK